MEEQSVMGAELDLVSAAMEEAAKHGLEHEVIHASLIAMKENPSLTIGQALAAGVAEWVK